MACQHFAGYEFDSTTAELRRAGEIVPLHPDAARVLTQLLTHPGEIVTADDAGLSKQKFESAIKRLQSALGGDCIETIPDTGTRLIAPLARSGLPRLQIVLRTAMLLVCITTMIITARMLWQGNPDPVRIAVLEPAHDQSPAMDSVASTLSAELVKDFNSTLPGRVSASASAPQAQYEVRTEVHRNTVDALLIRSSDHSQIAAWRHDFPAGLPPSDKLAREIVRQFGSYLLR
ncbi:MAG: hypothetical protein JO022_06300 [Acidobacteriaceae bacterium]|nr:hypothetical protein [Acidobacteriaceae bacterium]